MRKLKTFLSFAIAIGLFFSLAFNVKAQTGLGSITGEVTDPSGAVIPGAKVAAVNIDTGVRKEVVTTGSGSYFIPDLIPGKYNLEATATGFKKLIHQGIALQVEDRLSIKLALSVGTAAQTVQVTADTGGLRTQDAQTGEVITHNLIEEMPDLNRDPFSLITLAGNVQGDGSRAGINLGLGSSIYSGASTTRVNGGRTQGVEYLVDGVPVSMGFVHNVANATPAMDDVSEFKVITNGLSAEYGRLSGGAVSLSTMSGTNQLHGQLFEYNQNAFLNANSWQNDAQKAPKGNFRQNDFGVSMGGPVLLPHLYDGRNRTFWYVSYEGVRNSSAGSVSLGQTITDQERTGDLTDIGTGPCTMDWATNSPTPTCPNYPWAQVYDPYQNSYPNKVLDPQTGNMTYEKYLAGGDGRHIPASEMNPLVQQIIKLMPHPNHAPTPGTGTAGNYLARQSNTTNQNNWSVRLDQNISNASSLYGRFNYSTGNTYVGPYNPVLGTYSGTNINGGFNAVLHYSHTFSPTTLFDVHVGGIYNPWDTGSHLPANFSNAGMGFSSDVLNMIGGNNIVNFKTGPMTEGQTVSGLVQGGQYNALLQSANYYNVNSTSYDYAGSLTKILGRHSLKFGYEGRRYYDDPLSSAQSNASSPGDGYGFDAAAVATPYVDLAANDDTWFNQAYADGVGQFLMGIDSWTRVTGATGRALAENYYASYLQDDFKLNSKLTLNLGIRWETESPVTERHNNMTVWDPNAPSLFTIDSGYNWDSALTAAGLNPAQVRTPGWVTNGYPNGNLLMVDTPQHPSRLASNWHPWNFSPRLGAAYSITPRTVISGSFAVMYLPTSGNLTTYGDAPGVAYASSLNNQNTQVCCNVSIPQLGLQTISAPFTSAQYFPFEHSTYVAEAQTTQSGTGTGGMDVNAHMPREYDWGLNVQHQFNHDWLVELSYSANASNTLLGVGNPSRFPADLHTGGPNGTNAKIYTTPVQSPFASQFCPQGGCAIGPVMNVGYLEYLYPYYGPVNVEGENNGTSHYESGNVRVEHRYKSGLYVLFNYTFSKLLDNIGGPDSGLGNPGQGTGTGGKSFQQVYDINSVYGLSPFDETHVAGLTYIYNLPFGAGRQFMYATDGLKNKLLQGVAGGWNVAGNVSWNSGTPVTISATGTNVDQGPIYDFVTFASLAPGATVKSLFNKNFQGPGSVVVPPGTAPKSQSISAFNASAIANGGQVESFTNGNLPQDIGIFRNPGDWNSNISVMKNFILAPDGTRYLQLRLESNNFLNHPGYGGYDSTLSDNAFGQITGPANGSRAMQISGRFVF